MKKQATYFPELKTAIIASLKGEESITSEGQVFNDNLGLAELTVETVDKVNEYVTNFSAAGMEAVGDYALATMKKNMELNNIVGQIEAGSFGNVKYSITGKAIVNIPPSEKGGEVTKGVSFGQTRMSLDFVAGSGGAGLSSIKKAIKEKATEMLKDK